VPESVPEQAVSQSYVTEATRDNDEGDLPTAPAKEAEEVARITKVTYDKDEGDLPTAEYSSPTPNIASQLPLEVVLESPTAAENNEPDQTPESPAVEQARSLDCSLVVENNEPEQDAPESPAVEQAPRVGYSPVVENNGPEPVSPEPESTIAEKNDGAEAEPQCSAPVVNNVVEDPPAALEVPEREPESTLSPLNIEDGVEPRCSIPALNNEETPTPLEITEPEPEPKPKPEPEPKPDLECMVSELSIESDVKSQCSSLSKNIEEDQDGEGFIFPQGQPELDLPALPQPKPLRSARSISPPTIKKRGETDSEAVQRLGLVVTYLQNHNTKLLGIEKDRAALSALESVRNENVRNYIDDPTAAFASMSEQLDLALSEKRKLAEQNAQLAEEIAGEKRKREKTEERAKHKEADLETRQQEKLENLRREKRKAEDASASELKAAKQEIEQLQGNKALSEKMLSSELEEVKSHIVQLNSEKMSAEEKLGSQLEEARRQIEQLKTEKVEQACALFPIDSNIEKKPSPDFQIDPTLFTGNWDILVDVAPAVAEPEIANVPLIPSWIWDLGILVVMALFFYLTCFLDF